MWEPKCRHQHSTALIYRESTSTRVHCARKVLEDSGDAKSRAQLPKRAVKFVWRLKRIGKDE